MTEAAINVTMQFVESRQLCKQLLGADYGAQIQLYRDVIRGLMAERSLSVIGAVKMMIERNPDQDGFVLRVMAAGYEEMADK